MDPPAQKGGRVTTWLLVIAVLILGEIDYSLDRWREYRSPMGRQLDEIRDLPEAHSPYDWDRESAA